MVSNRIPTDPETMHKDVTVAYNVVHKINLKMGNCKWTTKILSGQ